MPNGVARIKVTGNVTEAIAALERLGLKAEKVGKETEGALGGAAHRVGGAFGKLGAMGNTWGVPFSGAFEAIASKMEKMKQEGAGLRERMGEVGKGIALGMGAGLAVVGTESIKAASSFQSAMELIHTQAGASQAEVDSMSKAVLNLAGQTATAPNELAAAIYHLESAGMHGKQALDALKTAALGAKVGHADLESVTNALNASIASGIPGVQNLHQAMGALNAIVGAGDMRMQDLADAMGTGVLASVKGYGLSLNDVGAALATFGDNNIRGADAATQLRMAVMSFAVPAKTAGKVLKTIGMNTEQLRKDMSTGGLTKALTDLREHLNKAGVSAKDVGGLLTQAFGKKAGTGINVLIDQYGRYMSKTKEVAAGARNFSADVAATKKTLAYQQDQLKASIEALGVKFGSFLIPKLREVAAVVGKVVGWLEKHKDVAMMLAAVVGGVLVAAFGAWAVSLFATGGALAFMMSPITLIVAGIAGLAFGIFELVKHWKTVWSAVTGSLEVAWKFIKRVFDDISRPVIGAFTTAIHGLERAWDASWRAIKHATSDVWDFLKDVFGWIVRIGLEPIRLEIEGVVTAWQVSWGFIKSVAQGAWHFLRDDVINPIETAFSHFVGFFEGVGSTIGGVFSGFFDGLKNAGIDAFNFVARLWNDTLGNLHFTIPSWVPVIGGDSFGFPRIPTIGGGGGAAPNPYAGAKGAAAGGVGAGVRHFALGGMVPDGWFMTGEHGPEMGYKSGSSVRIVGGGQQQAAGNTYNLNLTAMNAPTASDVSREFMLGLRAVGQL